MMPFVIFGFMESAQEISDISVLVSAEVELEEE